MQCKRDVIHSFIYFIYLFHWCVCVCVCNVWGHDIKQECKINILRFAEAAKLDALKIKDFNAMFCCAFCRGCQDGSPLPSSTWESLCHLDPRARRWRSVSQTVCCLPREPKALGRSEHGVRVAPAFLPPSPSPYRSKGLALLNPGLISFGVPFAALRRKTLKSGPKWWGLRKRLKKKRLNLQSWNLSSRSLNVPGGSTRRTNTTKTCWSPSASCPQELSRGQNAQASCDSFLSKDCCTCTRVSQYRTPGGFTEMVDSGGSVYNTFSIKKFYSRLQMIKTNKQRCLK